MPTARIASFSKRSTKRTNTSSCSPTAIKIPTQSPPRSTAASERRKCKEAAISRGPPLSVILSLSKDGACRRTLVHARLHYRKAFGFLQRDRALVSSVQEVEDKTRHEPDDKREPHEREESPQNR